MPGRGPTNSRSVPGCRSHGHISIRIGDLLAHLENEAVAAGAVILPGHAAGGLVTDGSRVVGITSESGVLIAGSGVVLASGGFSRSRELLELFVPDQAAAMPYGGVGNTGDGLRMAWMLGAGVADIGQVTGTYGQHAETTDDEHELLTANYLGAILVNARGERFADESESYKVLGSAVLSQPGRTAFQIFDSVVRARSKPGVPLSDMERLEELGHLVSAPTISALGRELGIPPERLERTVAHYNESVSGRHDDPFGRTGLVNGVGALVPVETGPFYAYAAVTAMTSTYGGLSVAADSSVKRVDGSRIDGLYAAGEVVGGFHGASYMTGTALTKALVFGYRGRRHDRARLTGLSPLFDATQRPRAKPDRRHLVPGVRHHSRFVCHVVTPRPRAPTGRRRGYPVRIRTRPRPRSPRARPTR